MIEEQPTQCFFYGTGEARPTEILLKLKEDSTKNTKLKEKNKQTNCSANRPMILIQRQRHIKGFLAAR
jgi:hypothetical protein